ncbi:MAG: hypothetical protein IPJ65_22580 [Archangiaceae bacterium]|nr:hypothetical protein [Archangiaceae bacterium]
MNKKILVALFAMTALACSSGGGGTAGGSGGNGGTGGSGGNAGGTGGARAGGTGGNAGGTGGARAGGTGGNGGGTAGSGGNTAGTSCANPIMVTLGTPTTGQVLNMAGRKLYYRVAVTANDWLIMFTDANSTNGNTTDPTISVYNEAGTTLLATIDDAYPRNDTDSTLYYHAATTGNLCVVVMDWDTWAASGDSTAHTEDVKLAIGKLNTASMANNVDTGSNDTQGTAQAGVLASVTGGAFTNVFGLLESGTDVDVYKFTIPATMKRLSVNFAPIGETPLVESANATNSYGSTLPRIALKLTNGTGAVVAALTISTDPKKTPTNLSIPVTAAQDYFLFIERPAGATPGSNDFYAVELETLPTDSPTEAADATNGVATGAEAITLAQNPDVAKQKDGFVLGNISPVTDVDFYSFPATAGDSIALACGALRDGSGLKGATVEILGPGGSLQTGSETTEADLVWISGPDGGVDEGATNKSVPAATTGTYNLKVTTTTQDATNTGNYYRCGVHVLSP